MPPLSRLLRLAPFGLALLPPVPGTAAETSPAVSGEPPRPTAAVVDMTDRRTYEPGEITITVGDTVRWANSSSRVHTVTADPALATQPDHVKLPEGAESFNSGTIAPGKSFYHRFKFPGEYRYFCIPHEADGMIGTVVVEAPREANRR
jgi:plastocyanin